MNNSNTMDDFRSAASDAASQAKSTGNRMADEVKSTSSVISGEVKNFIADLEEIVSSKTGGVDISQIKGDISKRIAGYKSSVEAVGHEAISQAKQKAVVVNTYVHDEPWKAVGVGFAVGLLLGVVISRR